MVTATDTDTPRGSVWLSPGPVGSTRRRGELPTGLDRERITVRAVGLLDAEGLSRFSMRRLAAELGVTAMSLYWYVDTKHDLLELALDRALGEVRLPPEPAGADWSERLRELARGHRAVSAAHPWVARLIGEYPNIGPHARAFDAALRRILEATGLSEAGRSGAHLVVSRFLQGHGCRPRGTAPGEFEIALDLLVAGIEGYAARAERVAGA
ncbi:TetR/AcrR family transcriptional regulator [Streptomyces sp. BI20]|uniref:TetR/AcrR family transcriptional regulator n=1 Tax=Streptomyces sp. BI20 TaxID=3403460 RepID=UPI003C796F46